MAIAPELRAQILRLYQAERWRVGTIARQLNLHRDTVKRVLEQACVMRAPAPLRCSLVDPYLPFMVETLTKFPTLTASRLHTMACERGYEGRPDHFRHIVARHRPRPPAQAYLRLRTLPGEQGQCDWGLCRARHRPHYAECPNMPSICLTSQFAGWRPRRTGKETRHSLSAYRFFRKVSKASSGLKVDGEEFGGTVLAKTRRFNSRSALR